MMSVLTAQFTPGPWKLTSVSQDTGAIGICKDRIMIAEVHNGYSFMDVVQGNHPKEQFANAELIAAAPDLYEALELVRYCAEQIAECPRYGGRSIAYMRATDILDRIGPALAKARGDNG